jgi:hypothetical protein
MYSHTVELWDRPGELRCMMRQRREGWEVCLLRHHHVVKADVFVDAAAAVAAADDWRQRLDLSPREVID